LEPGEKNSMVAFERALSEGFSIETDFRDRSGQLVVSHDPPGAGNVILADTFLSLFAEKARNGAYLAANIKADGLQDMLEKALKRAGMSLGCGYVFDMSIPDALGYLNRNLPVFSRQSDFEVEPALADRAAGIWVDNFSGAYPQIDQALSCLQKGYRVVFVSPELHCRPHEQVWDEIHTKGLHLYPKFSICTDFPSNALHHFSETE
jgi:glycerophosphoryl diester phosphodiesterase